MSKNITESRFMSTVAFNSIKKQFKSLGYPSTTDDGEVTIWDDDLAIIKAIPHSNGNSYLVAYDGNYMTRKA